MEYFVIILIVVVIFAVILISEIHSEKKRRAVFLNRLYSDYGKSPDKEYSIERFARIDSYYKRHLREGQIDDITWNDLNMDEVFKRIDTTRSAAGEEYLYYRLRTVINSKEEMTQLEAKVRYFDEHPDDRVSVQYLMSRLGYMGKYSIYDYLENLDVLGKRSNIKHIAADLLYIVCIAVMPVQLSVGILMFACLMVYNIVTYFKEKNEIDPYIVSFAYVVRLLETANGIIKLNLPVLSEENESLKASVNRLDSIRKNAWFVFSGNKYNTSSNPLEILADYLKMVFHVDIIQFNRMLHKLSAGYSETDNLIGTAGYLETAIAIGSFRASLKQGWCMPDIDYSGTGDKNAPNGIDGILSFSNLYHPLLTDAVKNNIETSGNKGVLITGSNASGKSTFLRSVALNIVLAQSVNTCTADKYTAPQCMPVSSMSLKDNLMSGESYYMAEIKSVKRILDMAAGLGLYVVCFIDEVLRGTNTVERIAASTEILKKLSDSGVTCFAATHDIELTRLLENSFDNYHFEEEIAEGDIHFPYKLLEGKSSCSNAILLLEIMGYDRSITDKARTLAEHFLENGRWEMLD